MGCDHEIGSNPGAAFIFRLNYLGNKFTLKTVVNPYEAVGFGFAALFAVIQKWSLPEFCWSTWLAGLVYAWGCVVTASLQIILTARSDKAVYEGRLPYLRQLSPEAFLLGVSVISVCAGLIAFHLYGFVFGFYGIINEYC